MNNLPPTENWMILATEAVKQHGGTKDPESTARNVWYGKLSAKQRRRWHRGVTHSLSYAERAYIRSETWAWKVAAVVSNQTGQMDPEKIAFASAAVAGFLAPDVANHLGGAIGDAWANFWAAIGSGFGLGGPAGTITIPGIVRDLPLTPGTLHPNIPIGPTLPPAIRKLFGAYLEVMNGSR